MSASSPFSHYDERQWESQNLWEWLAGQITHAELTENSIFFAKHHKNGSRFNWVLKFRRNCFPFFSARSTFLTKQAQTFLQTQTRPLLNIILYANISSSAIKIEWQERCNDAVCSVFTLELVLMHKQSSQSLLASIVVLIFAFFCTKIHTRRQIFHFSQHKHSLSTTFRIISLLIQFVFQWNLPKTISWTYNFDKILHKLESREAKCSKKRGECKA